MVVYSKRFLLVLAASLSMSGCVPVVVVGAAGGGKVLVDNRSSQEDGASSKVDDVAQESTKTTSAIVEIRDVEVQVVKPAEELKAHPIEQTAIPDSPAHQSQVQKQTEVSGQPSEISSAKATETRVEVSELVNRGWKVSLGGGDNSTGFDGILYFDQQQNFYGFDGCRYFRGKYQADVNSSFMINSLVVSSKGASDCGNEMTRNLFFVDSFRPHNGAVALYAKDVVAMTLSVQENFDAKDFLNKAKFKNSRSRRR